MHVHTHAHTHRIIPPCGCGCNVGPLPIKVRLHRHQGSPTRVCDTVLEHSCTHTGGAEEREGLRDIHMYAPENIPSGDDTMPWGRC